MQRELAPRDRADARTSSTRDGTNLASLVNLNQPLPSAPGAQRRARGRCRIRTSASSSGARRTASRRTRASTRASRSASRTGMRSASPTRWATRRTTRPSSSRRRDRTRSRRTRATSATGTGRATTTCGTASRRTSSSTCRSARTSFCATGSLSGVYAVRSGRPFTVNQSNNNVGQNMTGLPNQVGDPDGPETVDQWFNTAAFAPVAVGRRSATSCAIVCAGRASRRST